MLYRLTTPVTREDLAPLRAGDTVLLSGTVYTARDAAHQRMMALLRQPRCTPMAVSRQAVILYIATNGLLGDVPVEQVSAFANDFVSLLEREQPALIAEIDETGALSGAATEQIRTTLESYKKQVSAKWKA